MAGDHVRLLKLMKKQIGELGSLIALTLTLAAICLPIVLTVIATQWIIPNAHWRFSVGGVWAVPLWSLAILIVLPILDITVGVIARAFILFGIHPSEFLASTIGGTFLLAAVFYIILTPFYACLIAALVCAILNEILEPLIPPRNTSTEFDKNLIDRGS